MGRVPSGGFWACFGLEIISHIWQPCSSTSYSPWNYVGLATLLKGSLVLEEGTGDHSHSFYSLAIRTFNPPIPKLAFSPVNSKKLFEVKQIWHCYWFLASRYVYARGCNLNCTCFECIESKVSEVMWKRPIGLCWHAWMNKEDTQTQ